MCYLRLFFATLLLATCAEAKPWHDGTNLVANDSSSVNNNINNNIAFLVTVPSCPEYPDNPDNPTDSVAFHDVATVLRNSIFNSTVNNPDSKYDATIYAIIHPEAIECAAPSNNYDDSSVTFNVASVLEDLGYLVIVWEEPVNEEEISDLDLRTAMANSGKSLRDFMHLYAYKLIDHPVAVITNFNTLFQSSVDSIIDQLISSRSSTETIYFTKQDGLIDTGAIFCKPSDSAYDSIVDSVTKKNYNESATGRFLPEVGFDTVLQEYWDRNQTFHESMLADHPNKWETFGQNTTCGRPWDCQKDTSSWSEETKHRCRLLSRDWFAFRTSASKNPFGNTGFGSKTFGASSNTGYGAGFLKGFCHDNDDEDDYPSFEHWACSFQPPEDAVCLLNSNFTFGTLLIDTPGKYKLCEDIVFDPNPSGRNPAEAYEPDYTVYDKNNYGLGFFAAIAIAAPNVEIYLNCHTIQQSKGHALLQRFFAVFELANSPFIPSVGPAQFVGDDTSFRSATNVLIRGPGTIGRSSHHGIHGNENINITIEDVTFEDFEVAATSLNNVDNLVISNCEITHNRHDVPIVGLFSAARNILPYGKKLKELQPGYNILLAGETVSVEDAYDKLVAMVENVFHDVVHGTGFIDPQKHPAEFHLFDNEFRVVDGPCYAFLVHGQGPAVGGQGFDLSNDDNVTSSHVVLEHNRIRNIHCWTNEIPALVVDGVVVNDVRGSVFQTRQATSPDGRYQRNPVADLQLIIAQAIHDDVLPNAPELQTDGNTINTTMLDWAASPTTTLSPKYRCNGDSMHHVSKGMIVIRVEDTKGFHIRHNSIDSVENLTPPQQSDDNCTDYHAGASVENGSERQAGHVRAISVSASSGYHLEQAEQQPSRIVGNQITTITTTPSLQEEDIRSVIGIDIQGKSEGIVVEENHVDLLEGIIPPDDDNDDYIALRCRESTKIDSGDPRSIVIGDDNYFAQQVQVLRRRLRRFLESHQHIVAGAEWNNGGCPFARGAGYS